MEVAEGLMGGPPSMGVSVSQWKVHSMGLGSPSPGSTPASHRPLSLQ